MKPENYTCIIIPNDEKNTKTFYFSKRKFNFILILFSSLIILALAIVFLFILKFPYYLTIKKNHSKFVSERMEILALSQDLNRLKHMDNMIRSTLGANLKIDKKPILKDSIHGIYEIPQSEISYADNIPSKAPIEGFISQQSGNDGLFMKNSHYGIDIVAKEGAPFVAAAKGIVIFSGWTYEFGNIIILYHGDDYFTHYGHNKKNFKNKMDIVERGEVIGLVGSSGISTGPHLHFEIWKEFSPIDPLTFFPEYKIKDLTVLNE